MHFTWRRCATFGTNVNLGRICGLQKCFPLTLYPGNWARFEGPTSHIQGEGQSSDSEITFLARFERKKAEIFYCIPIKKLEWREQSEGMWWSFNNAFDKVTVMSFPEGSENLDGSFQINIHCTEMLHLSVVPPFNNTVPRLSLSCIISRPLNFIRYCLRNCCSAHCLCSGEFLKVSLCKSCVSARSSY